MASKVFLHVGAPQSGSDLVRDVLSRHRRRLTRVGVLYPPGHLGHDGGHLDAVLDVLGLSDGPHPPADGAWDRLAETVRDWRRGTAVVSHALLADVREDQVERIVSSFGDAEVHMVYVAEDLGRQVPDAWQQWVHHGGEAPFATYAARVAQRDAHRMSRVFWGSHDVAEVVRRWAAHLPAEHTHVVTVPRGDDGSETWSRVARTVGVDPLRFRVGSHRTRPTGSLVGTEVVRLLNAAADGPVDPQRLQALRAHAEALGGGTPRLPAVLLPLVRAEAERAADALAALGADVVGDLEDLLPAATAFTDRNDEVTPPPAEVLAAQTALLLALTGAGKAAGPAGVRRRALRVLMRLRGRATTQPDRLRP